jgi:sRNA-binding regulator protein Hfq
MPRQPRPSRAPQPSGPSTAGQIEQIRHLARRMGLEDAELTERIGGPLESLDHVAARAAIANLRKEMEESGTWQPRVGEGPDHEGEYLAKLRDHQVPIEIRLIDGEKVLGIIEDFTPYLIRIRQSDSGSELFVRKLAIAYYHTQAPIDDFE